MLGLGNNLASASIHEQMYSLLLDGTGDYLDTGTAFQSTHRGSFSYALWVKPDDGRPGNAKYLLGTLNSAPEDLVAIQLGKVGHFIFAHESNNDPGTVQSNSAVFADGAVDWQHWCVTVTYTNGGADTSYVMYVNGALIASTLTGAVTEANHEAWTSSDNLYIGTANLNGTPSSGAFPGKLDDVALWNVVLDADAVAAVYNSGKPFDLTADRGNYDNASALQGYWRMNDGSGTTVANSAGSEPGAGSLAGNATFSTDTPDD